MDAARSVAEDIVRASHGDRDADAILLGRCRAGEREAFSILLGRYRERIVNLAFQLLGHREDAEDVAQDAFTRAFRHIGTFRGESEFYTWLYRITVNLCLGRKRRARPSEGLHHELDGALVEHSDVTKTDTRLAVEETMLRLTPLLRTVLVLRELQGLSYEEMGAILRVPAGTVRSRLHEARRKFREAWAQACDMEDA